MSSPNPMHQNSMSAHQSAMARARDAAAQSGRGYTPPPLFRPTQWQTPTSGGRRGGPVWRLIKALFTIAFLAFVVFVAYLLFTSGSTPEPPSLPDPGSGL